MFKLEIGQINIEAGTNNLAEQASGSCLIKLGETTILATCQIGEERPNMGFFPLTCEYQERYYAAGRILGSRFIRREGRPSTEAILNSRLIDRAIRPLFPKGLKREVQVITTCLSWDQKNDPDILGLLGSSLALLISDIPWNGPLAAVRVGQTKNNEFILNPTYEEKEESPMEIVLAGIEKDGDILINMIECQGEEVEEKTILAAYDFAKPFLKKIIGFQKEIKEKEGKKKVPLPIAEKNAQLEQEVKKIIKEKLKPALYQTDRQKSKQDLTAIKEEILAEVGEENIDQALDIFEREKEELLKKMILEEEKRPDKRKLDQIRDIKVETGVLPQTHGSAIFSRGLTKALSILTLGSPSDQQLLEGMEISGKKRFLHHYNFPPYSTGEVRPLRGPGRREIGHGMLAEKAIRPVIPKFEDFPYTIRVVSEMLSSNGSTSMASVSAACLALMDGGVPIKRPTAGIAIGLIADKDLRQYKLLTDIQGPEDHYGNMDFKVAGTEKGITAIQMDVKIAGINREIMEQALNRAKKARLEILSIQNKVLSQPRKELSEFAPRVYIVNIKPDKIGRVIGSGGRIINEIIEDCGVSIDIEESGKIFITADKDEAAQKAIEWIKNLTKEIKIGEEFQGKVKRIFNFGAMVEIFPGQEGLVRISEFANFRINKVEDVVRVGDIIPVKVIGIDDQGRINLSAKEAGFKVKGGIKPNDRRTKERRY